MANPTYTPEVAVELAAAAFDPKETMLILRTADYFQDNGDPLVAASLAYIALNHARIGHAVGKLTLSSATRIRRIAEALGCPSVSANLAI